MFFKRRFLSVTISAALALAVGVCLSANAAPPSPPSETVSASIILNVTNPQALMDYIQATLTPGDPNYHRFLTVVQYLKSFGITIDKIYADNLDITVSGTVAEFNAAFAIQLQDHVKNGKRFHRPAQKFSLPS